MRELPEQLIFDIDFNLPEGFGYWFAGLVDGEGCFQIILSQFKSGRKSPRFDLTVKLRADDADMLIMIQTVLQVGHLYHYRQVLPRRDQVGWCCSNRQVARWVIVPLLTQYPLRSKKARDFAIWKEAVLFAFNWGYTIRRLGWIDPLWQKMCLYKTQLTEIRRYTSNPLKRFYDARHLMDSKRR